MSDYRLHEEVYHGTENRSSSGSYPTTPELQNPTIKRSLTTLGVLDVVAQVDRMKNAG